MRILYLPIHISGTYHDRSVTNKRGLYNALAKRGAVQEIDYIALKADVRYGTIWAAIKAFEPNLLWAQLQGADDDAIAFFARLRTEFPAMAMVNWNGDVYEQHLTSEKMLDLLRHVDMQLVVNGSVLDTYSRLGIPAAFCPFGYEPPIGDLPDVPAYDVIFLGNNNGDKRQQLYDVLRALTYRVGIYGTGWPQAEGECNYDFAYGAALYKRAKICISDNQFPDARGYMSDRPIQIMGAGGGMLLQQYVKDMRKLTGYQSGYHYFEYNKLEDIEGYVEDLLTELPKRKSRYISLNAQDMTSARHTWDNRVSMVLDKLLPGVRERAS